VGAESELTNIDFAGDLQQLSVHFVDSRTAESMSEQIKISLADLALNVHILGSLTALVLRLKTNLTTIR
jgi:hypothetical protein